MFGAFMNHRGSGITGYYEGYEGVARERPEITATYTGDMIGVVDPGGNARELFVHGKALLEYSIDTNEVTAKFSGIRYVDNEVPDDGISLDFEVEPVSVSEGGAFSNMGGSCAAGCVEGGFYGPGAPESAGRFVKVYERTFWGVTSLTGGFGVKRE